MLLLTLPLQHKGKTMSDSRFHLEVKFQIYGKTYEWKPSLNWSDNGDGIDQRIVDWFRDSHNKAYYEYQASNMAAECQYAARKAAEDERKEYERLKAKFEGGNHG